MDSDDNKSEYDYEIEVDSVTECKLLESEDEDILELDETIINEMEETEDNLEEKCESKEHNDTTYQEINFLKNPSIDKKTEEKQKVKFHKHLTNGYKKPYIKQHVQKQVVCSSGPRINPWASGIVPGSVQVHQFQSPLLVSPLAVQFPNTFLTAPTTMNTPVYTQKNISYKWQNKPKNSSRNNFNHTGNRNTQRRNQQETFRKSLPNNNVPNNRDVPSTSAKGEDDLYLDLIEDQKKLRQQFLLFKEKKRKLIQNMETETNMLNQHRETVTDNQMNNGVDPGRPKKYNIRPIRTESPRKNMVNKFTNFNSKPRSKFNNMPSKTQNNFVKRKNNLNRSFQHTNNNQNKPDNNPNSITVKVNNNQRVVTSNLNSNGHITRTVQISNNRFY